MPGSFFNKTQQHPVSLFQASCLDMPACGFLPRSCLGYSGTIANDKCLCTCVHACCYILWIILLVKNTFGFHVLHGRGNTTLPIARLNHIIKLSCTGAPPLPSPHIYILHPVTCVHLLRMKTKSADGEVNERDFLAW
jgi:hypothetical protein